MDISVTGCLCIEVIEDCNLNCDICVRGNNTHKRITRNVVEKIFDNITYVRTLVFSGGEVTLAYEEIKMILDVIKEKGVVVDNYHITVNGTIYNKKLFDLLRENFSCGRISISCDYFHDKSIVERYKGNVDKVVENIAKIMKEPHFDCLYGLPKYLIDEGRAKSVTNVRKEEASFMPFVTMIKNNRLYVGPEIAFDVDGNLVNTNSTYLKNSNNTLGNIFHCDMVSLLLSKSIKNDFNTFTGYKFKNFGIEYNYFNAKKDNYVIRDGSVIKRDRVIVSDQCDEAIYDDKNRLIMKYIKQRKRKL